MGKTTEKVDHWFEKAQNYITAKIGSFVAFLFLLIALGAFAGIIVTQRWPEYSIFTVILPGAAGIIAYYNRPAAIFLFGVLMLLIVFII